MTTNIAARLAALAEGGEIVLSEETCRRLLAKTLLATQLRDANRHPPGGHRATAPHNGR